MLEGLPAPDVVGALDARGNAVHGGELAALPLLKRLGVLAAVRASFHLYNTLEEVDRLAAELKALRRPPGST